MRGEYSDLHGFDQDGAFRSKRGHFHFFDCIDDREVSHSLFEAAFAWLRGKGMVEVVGPFGIGFMGMGALVDGFEHRAVMTRGGDCHEEGTFRGAGVPVQTGPRHGG